ncbi:hypothetical protein SASPL_147946 [Salvia splendens]|uniref:Uncharacterized protein n=1 Tax=Salvia splendens TaxID=180675 RepID=A0A8X8W9C0_SALSN|nr:hypothetical protein SASPL_147946 [Salvia splendens]
MDRSHYPDGDGWINLRLIRVPAGSRDRGPRDDEELIHHLFSFICRSHIGEPAGSVGASPLTGGLAGGVDGSSPAGYVIGGEGRASPTGGVTGGEGRASPTGDLASGEGDAIFEVTDSPVMSDEEFVRRYVITDSNKEAWERNKAEAEREVKALFGENCLDLEWAVFGLYICDGVGDVVNLVGDGAGDAVNLVGDVLLISKDSTVNLSRNSVFAAVRLGLMADVCGLIRPALAHLQTVAFEQPKLAATLKRLHLFEKMHTLEYLNIQMQPFGHSTTVYSPKPLSHVGCRNRPLRQERVCVSHKKMKRNMRLPTDGDMEGAGDDVDE